MSAFRHIAIVVNPGAGSGRAGRICSNVAAILKARSISFDAWVGAWPEDFGNYSEVWIMGGDGTLNFFLNKYPDIRLPLAIFPGGSGNDFSSLLYGTKDIPGLVSYLLQAGEKAIDGARCNGHYLVNGIGIGFDGAIAGSLAGKNKKPGKASFMAAVWRKILFYRKLHASFTIDDRSFETDLLMVNVMNGSRAGGGFMVAPDADPADGWLQVNLVRPLGLVTRLRYLPLIEKGKHTGLARVEYTKARLVTIICHTPAPAHCDGEYFESDRFVIELLPQKWKFRCNG